MLFVVAFSVHIVIYSSYHFSGICLLLQLKGLFVVVFIMIVILRSSSPALVPFSLCFRSSSQNLSLSLPNPSSLYRVLQHGLCIGGLVRCSAENRTAMRATCL
jgi:hypothetical protein